MPGARRIDRVVAWRPGVPGVSEVFHAHFAEHAYPPHTHDTWTLFVVDRGAIHYGLDRHRRGADASMVSVLPPHVVHDGRPATTSGYRKRVIYLEPGVLGEALIGRAVDRPFVADARLRRGVDRLHALLRAPDDAMAAESVLALVAERLRGHLAGREPAPAGRAGREPAPPGRTGGEHAATLAERLRALLDAHLFEPLTLAAAASALATDPAHLVRSFTRSFGVAPHAYVIGRRIEAARVRLLDGEPIARVAAEVGFFDQAHLTRHFRRHVGTTPGRYARAG